MADSSNQYSPTQDGTPESTSSNGNGAYSSFATMSTRGPAFQNPPTTHRSNHLLSSSTAINVCYLGNNASSKANHHLRAAILKREKDHIHFGTCPCTSFGLDRETRYPHYFFCSNCKLWDNEAQANNLSAISSTSCQLCCHAEHKADMYFPTQPQKMHHTLRKTARRRIDVSQLPDVLPAVDENQEISFSYAEDYSNKEDDDDNTSTTKDLNLSTQSPDAELKPSATDSRKKKFGEDHILPESQVQPTITAVPFRHQQQEHLDNFNYMKEQVSQLELEINRTDELAREVSRLCRLVARLKHEKQVIRTKFSQYVKDDGERKTTQAYLPETTAPVSSSKKREHN